ncbi:hypothetical protein FK268_11175 [Tsukamurella sputi]|uniref:Uncharacterized protein n=1 Tax=Tsukamurella sputi TaxID=2591848 RepID=A0A5C5RME5_9ACTN|nr:hypothetical protein [Tsukamurella sputi]TWS24167.1 hypothetical protein FK268_11175 [Tsukamurella sputi]
MSDQATPFDPRKQWIFGYEEFGNEALPAHLLKVSVHHAHSAITKASSKEPNTWLEAAIHAGGAVELLAKYHLSSVNPILLVEMRNAKDYGILHVLGEHVGPPGDPQKRRNVKTRGPEDCLTLVALMSGRKLPQGDLTKVLDARNSAVHMGLVDGPELQGAVAAMVRVVDALIEIAGIPRSNYWGSQIALIDQIASRETLQKALKQKIDAASRIAQSLAPEDPDQVREDLSRNSEDGSLFDLEEYPEGTSYWYAQKCPVCKRAGTVFCSRWITAPEEDFEGDSFVQEHAHGVAYRCGSCHLELDEREMLELRLGGDVPLGYRAATEDEMLSYQEHLAEMYYEHQAELRRGK